MKTACAICCIVVAPVLIAACATVSREDAAQSGASLQHEFADEAQDYRAQSYALWDMADRRQAEATILSEQLGPNDPEVQRKLRLAQDLQKAAEEADRKGRTARRQVPHAMVQ